jgi:hypothetical protein
MSLKPPAAGVIYWIYEINWITTIYSIKCHKIIKLQEMLLVFSVYGILNHCRCGTYCATTPQLHPCVEIEKIKPFSDCRVTGLFRLHKSVNARCSYNHVASAHFRRVSQSLSLSGVLFYSSSSTFLIWRFLYILLEFLKIKLLCNPGWRIVACVRACVRQLDSAAIHSDANAVLFLYYHEDFSCLKQIITFFGRGLPGWVEQ